jgi:hypothetical protein
METNEPGNQQGSASSVWLDSSRNNLKGVC